ncbi:hypothetical protein V1522DRAFT_453438 [Lipomyces starkeyi]
MDNRDTVTVGDDSKSRKAFEKSRIHEWITYEAIKRIICFDICRAKGIYDVTLDKPGEYPCTLPGCKKLFTQNQLRLRHAKRHQNWNSLNPVNDDSMDEIADPPYKQVPKQWWITAIERLMQGYMGRNGASIQPAVIAPNGCHLPRIVPGEDGYIFIGPVAVFTGNARKDEPKKKKHSSDSFSNCPQRG